MSVCNHSVGDWDDLEARACVCERACACARLPCRRSHTRGGMIVFQAALPLPVFPELERFDLPTFIFVLTFLKNLATLWEVWLGGILRGIESGVLAANSLPPSNLHPILSQVHWEGGIVCKNRIGEINVFLFRNTDLAKDGQTLPCFSQIPSAREPSVTYSGKQIKSCKK